MNMIKKPVPNFWKGREGLKPLYVVIHTGEGSAEQIYSAFMNEEKSSQYLVLRDGEVWQFVDEADTAWANGVVVRPTARLVKENFGVNQNRVSISIEHEGFAAEGITEAQYKASGELVWGICARHGIPLDREHVLRHNEIRADKECPGKVEVRRIVALAVAPAAPVALPAPTMPPAWAVMLSEAISKLAAILEEILNLMKGRK